MRLLGKTLTITSRQWYRLTVVDRLWSTTVIISCHIKAFNSAAQMARGYSRVSFELRSESGHRGSAVGKSADSLMGRTCLLWSLVWWLLCPISQHRCSFRHFNIYIKYFIKRWKTYWWATWVDWIVLNITTLKLDSIVTSTIYPWEDANSVHFASKLIRLQNYSNLVEKRNQELAWSWEVNGDKDWNIHRKKKKAI